jgi:hypothetical protein
MANSLLPVGSVVRLEGADALVMVMGFQPQLEDVSADYLGVVWPQGLVSDDAALAFDADAVAEVVHRGFWDEEGEAALAAVRRYRDAVDDLRQQFRAFMDGLTTDDIRSYRAEYLFDHMEDEPEPDLLDEYEDEPEPDFPDEGGLA